ncbi:hypothetical protein H1O16_gp401 [Burkholderia phage BcepSaruman]|uniref:Uncharacterized protein n=1 Tax=Burkholderia phage BcepSaruman TaxID=2530032 RepID=A0A4D5ZCX4_9CAUD|nr:hypothetical protein H1O16_gp401 [Burkholderia phage BcepSaruman]QBX06814.1 hypothetical protein BcepSaruman_401 [Burkholderia phage BcepSaruman]
MKLTSKEIDLLLWARADIACKRYTYICVAVDRYAKADGTAVAKHAAESIKARIATLLEGSHSLNTWLVKHGHIRNDPWNLSYTEQRAQEQALRETRIAWITWMLDNWS